MSVPAHVTVTHSIHNPGVLGTTWNDEEFWLRWRYCLGTVRWHCDEPETLDWVHSEWCTRGTYRQGLS